MKTVKTSREFKGSPISLRAVALLEQWSLPFSVREFVVANSVRAFSGKITTGDVDCTWDMTVCQNGFWSVQADFHDGGTVAGDFFVAHFLLDRDHSVGADLAGSILDLFDSRHLSLTKVGSDRWIRENWHKFERSGPTVQLHAAPALGDLPVFVLVTLGVVIVAVFQQKAAERCDRDSPNSPLCIHVDHIGPDDGNPGPDDP